MATGTAAVQLALPRLRPDQWDIVRHPAEEKFVACGRRWGKALPLDTPIPTPNGWTTIGDLTEGNLVFDDQGSPTVVTAVTEVMYGHDCYRVGFSDGSSLVADGGHNWLTWDKAARKAIGRCPRHSTVHYEAFPAVRTTAEIRTTLRASNGRESNHSVPVAGPLQYPARDLLVDPYLLGAWLGDGDTNSPMLTGDDQEIPDRIGAGGTPVREMTGGVARSQRWSMAGRRESGIASRGKIRLALRAIGVLGNKHIPRQYLESSIPQREELLKGLMDTDGSVEPNGRCRFEVMHARLAADTLELVIGLGFKANLRTKRAMLNGRDAGTVYRLAFQADRPVFHLERKLVRQRFDAGYYRKKRYITAVEPVSSVPVRCIQVDAPSHCYLAGESCLVTHNSTMVGAVSLAAASQGDRCGWGAPNYKNTVPLWSWVTSAIRPLVKAKICTINRAERIIEFPLGNHQYGFLGIYSLENADSIRGEAFDLFGVDEAARVSEYAYVEVIQPTLADRRGQSFVISTPKGKNWFWREWCKGLTNMGRLASWTASTLANPIPQIQRAALLAKDRVPDNVYRQEWLAEFIEDALVLINSEWFANGENRYVWAPYTSNREALARWLSWDTAFKDKEGNAFSACVVGELLPDWRLRIREVYRDRLSFPALIAKIREISERYRGDGNLHGVIIEDKASGTSAVQTLMASSDDWIAELVRPWMPSGTKMQRAAQAGVWCENGSIMFPYPAPELPWLQPFEQELYESPHSTYMDQTDAFSQLVLYLENYLRVGFEGRSARGDLYSPVIAGMPDRYAIPGALAGRRN